MRIVPTPSGYVTRAGVTISSRRIELLRAIHREHSITAAAKAIGMTYKAAWDAVDELNNLSGTQLVERVVGGKGGGGARLTSEGCELLEFCERYEEVQRRVSRTVLKLPKAGRYLDILDRMTLKTSARNHFAGKVVSVRRGAVNDEIGIRLGGGELITAVITRESSVQMGLKRGTTVVVLLKASWIMLATRMEGVRLSARNRLDGTIISVHPGAVTTEVKVELKGKTILCASITNDSAVELGLAEGVKVTAVFKSSHVIVGVPA